MLSLQQNKMIGELVPVVAPQVVFRRSLLDRRDLTLRQGAAVPGQRHLASVGALGEVDGAQAEAHDVEVRAGRLGAFTGRDQPRGAHVEGHTLVVEAVPVLGPRRLARPAPALARRALH